MGSGLRPAGQPFGGAKLGDILFDEGFSYIQTVDFTGSDNQIKNIPIQADAHFVVVATYMNCSVASGAGTFAGACVNRGGSVVQLTDGGNQRQLSNAQIPANCLFGTAYDPYVWPLRKLFKANTSITLNVTDVTGGVQKTDYVFAGFKVPLDHGAALGIR